MFSNFIILEVILHVLSIQFIRNTIYSDFNLRNFGVIKFLCILIKFGDTFLFSLFMSNEKLKFTDFGIGEKFPTEIYKTNKELVSIYMRALANKHNAKLIVDMLYISGKLYKPRED